MAAITSRDPLSTRFSGRDGSYSQMAWVVSTAAIFVIFAMKSTFARFITCAIHLQNIFSKDSELFIVTNMSWFDAADQGFNPRRSWISSTVSHIIVLHDVLSRVAVLSCRATVRQSHQGK